MIELGSGASSGAEAAHRYARRAHQLAPDNALFTDTLAATLRALGRATEARELPAADGAQ